MSSADDGHSPIEGVVPSGDAVSEHTAAVLKLLGNETRVAILLALWEAEELHAGGAADETANGPLSFSELRRLVGVADPGNFNYHLDMLEGTFIAHTEEGYHLKPAGKRLVRAVVANGGFDDVELETSEIDLPCHLCGAPVAIVYRNQRLYNVCTSCEGTFSLDDTHPDGVLGGWFVHPSMLRERSATEIYEVNKTTNLHNDAMEVGGICPACHGRCVATLHVCEAHDATDERPCSKCNRAFDPVVRYACRVCKYAKIARVSALVWLHPAVVSFFYQRGIEFGYPRATVETANMILDSYTEKVITTDPIRIQVTITYDGDEIALTYDKNLEVIAIEEPG